MYRLQCFSFVRHVHRFLPERSRLWMSASVLIMILASGCGSSSGDSAQLVVDEDDAVDATISEVIIQGTVEIVGIALDTVVEAKSSDAQLTQIPIGPNQQFSASRLRGSAPWLLRVAVPSGSELYGIAFNDGTHNINSFSDLTIRNWFAQQSIDIKAEFESPNGFNQLPSDAEISATTAAIFQLLDPVLNSYDVSGTDIVSEDYEADDQGIDAFLAANLALISNQLVNFVLTDPVTGTQSQTESFLSLSGSFSDEGNTAPSSPGSVRAIGSAVDEIIVLWESASDDVAVASYQVIRNGSLVGTTPYPVFTDSGLLSNETYSYEIIATDAAGNSSVPTSPVVGTVRASDDVTPPAPPTLLTPLSSSGSAVQFLWAQTNIGNVVSFRVYRGTTTQLGQPLVLVTSTSVTDTTVEAGVSYCYQVSALNASGIESALSDELCVDAGGDIGNGGADTALPVFTLPPIEALNCDSVLSDALLQAGTNNIEPGCYSVPTGLTVAAGATLRLNAGVVLVFGEGAELIVQNDAALIANGTPANPIVLTGAFKLRGYWGGVNFQNSTSATNLLRGVVIEYAGGVADTRAAVAITDGRSRFRLEDSWLRFNRNIALSLNRNQSVIDSFVGNRISDNDGVGFIGLDLLKSLDGNSIFTGNDEDVIDVPRNFFDFSVTIPDLGVPIRWNGVLMSRAALTIEPGAELIMVGGASIEVDGALSVQGTAQNPISLTGRGTVPGSWAGFNLSGRGDKVFDHVSIAFAGESANDAAAIRVACSVETAPSLSVNNADITDSAGWGIFVSGTGCETQIGDTLTYLNNALGNANVP